MRYLFWSGFLALLVMWAVPAATAQSPAAEVRIERVETTDFPEISLWATFIDGQGRVITDLDRSNLVLRMGDEDIPITDLRTVPPDQVAVYLVLALDISASIDGEGLAQLQHAAGRVIASLTPDDQIALVLFGEQHQVIHEFTSDHGAVINSINQITVDSLENYTALYNGSLQSVRLAAEAPSDVRRAVVVITDGTNTVPEGSETVDIDTVVRAASDADVPMYTIGVGPDIAPEQLRLLASDGNFQQIERLDLIEPAFQDVVEQLSQQYVIRSRLDPFGSPRDAPLSLQVRIPARGLEMDAHVPAGQLLPERPFVQLSFTEPMTLTQPTDFQVDILWQAEPQQAQLLLDDQIVMSENLSTPSWSFTWIPTGTGVLSGEHTLAVRVIDDSGNAEQTSGQPVWLVDPQATSEGGIPILVWIIIGVMLLLLAITAIIAFIVSQRSQRALAYESGSQQMYAYHAATPFPEQSSPQQQNGDLPSTEAASPSEYTVAPVGSGAPAEPGDSMKAAPAQPERQPRQPAKRKNKPHVRRTELAEPPVQPGGILLVERGNTSSDHLRLSPDKEYFMGRDPRSHLVMKDNQVSGTHAKVSFMEQGFTIVDMSSTNGIRVNGKRIQQLRLQHNDRVAIGNIVLVFKQTT